MTRPEQFRSIAEAIATLYEKKDAAYGDSFGSTFDKLGPISLATRISDKTNRLCVLVTDPKVDDLGEKIEDTLMDLAAYAIMGLMKLGKCPVSSDNAGIPLKLLSGIKQGDYVRIKHPIGRTEDKYVDDLLKRNDTFLIRFSDGSWYGTKDYNKIKKDIKVLKTYESKN